MRINGRRPLKVGEQRIIIGSLLLSVLMGVAGCTGQAIGPATPLAPIAPAATATLLITISPSSDCQPDVLQRWIAYSSTNSDAFIKQLNQSAAISASQAATLISQLEPYRSLVGGIPVPNCASNDSKLVFAMMDNALKALTVYGQGQRTDLGSIITAANTQYQQIKQEQQTLISILTQLQGHP